MKFKNLVALISTLLLLPYACNEVQKESLQSVSSIPTVNTLSDFEIPSSLEIWEGTVSQSNEFPAHGKSSLKLNAPDGGSLWLESERLPKNWSAYELLKFDIYNPSAQLYYGQILIVDELATDEQVELKGQGYSWNKVFLNTGWNHFEFKLKTAMVSEGDRPLALDKIRKFRLSFGVVDHPIYVDNIRLVSGEESSKTASKVEPADCRIVIDNRHVYPTLAGPVEEIKSSSEIVQLRKQAKTEVNKLEKEVAIAEMQGYQMLYQRIPLITANVGLGIRSKLVWFQNEKEEKKILEYVISSCTKAVKEIEVLLSAGITDRDVPFPEDDSKKNQTFFVPPLPSFNKLKIEDGFYRNESGEPVFIFSMLQVNEGPLMDYFAPFNHRIESFTIGGGSRYDIETSPVYEAFHKYADTHRVGWDGWCGHLIKDRWAMGGKKENVVICLESPDIRKAVLDYMKQHQKEWANNPKLLYNIMAYELQYICYCERSQQMFHDYLKSKYSDISSLNKIWDTGFKSFAAIVAPATYNGLPVDDVNRAAWYDWANFNTKRFTDYMKWIKSEMRKFDKVTPICAGGTSSMLHSSNSITGIDEEMIINGVDDVILNESYGSPIFSDLLLSLSDKRKVMVDPEMGGGTHGLLLQFLHGKSDITKWWWASAPSSEYLHMNQSSLPHSKTISLSDIDEVLRVSLDIRRLGTEIAEFTASEPEVAIFYSKTNMVQMPPNMVKAGQTPYLKALHAIWEGSRFLGVRTGFVSEKQIIKGKLGKFKLLLVPAAKYMIPEVTIAIVDYIKTGGTALVIPESFTFDQYAREHDYISELDINITGVTHPSIIAEGEKVQNYDQSFSQKIIYGESQKKITVLNKGIFEGSASLPTFLSEGIAQTLDPGTRQVLAIFDDGNPAIIQAQIGNGNLYYLAAPLRSNDYHLLLSLIVKKVDLKRPIIGVDKNGALIMGAEVRAVERKVDYLIYASNLTAEAVEFELKGSSAMGDIIDLRSLRVTSDKRVKLEPYQEKIFKITKISNQ